MKKTTEKSFINEMKSRVLLLDGAMGTMIQKLGLTEENYRGSRFFNHDYNLKGLHDVLSLTQPDIIARIHRQYLEAGADIITTNSFNSNEISLGDYGLSSLSRELARASATIARAEAERATALDPSRPRFVAGTVGPSNKSASIATDLERPERREVTFDDLLRAYKPQIEGLAEGGVDLIIIETAFDTLNAKAALRAVVEVARERDIPLPVIVSATLTESGRTLSGQTLEAFYHTIADRIREPQGREAGIIAVGFNCGFGPEQLLPFARRLAMCARTAVSCHPNAGLPDDSGRYGMTPEIFAEKIRPFIEEGLVNIIGGCCGTTPEHIRAVKSILATAVPRDIPEKTSTLTLSNLEPLTVDEVTGFINIGERTNVAGSAKFARLIREGNYAEAVEIARKQIDAGAQIIDVCMDDAMIDAPRAMTRFLNLLASEPDIARVPWMIDSSDWNVLEAGLKVSQGKVIVNSISLKEGEKAFLDKAATIASYGAAAVVMLFDERGQADTFERKKEVASRSYKLLTESGFPPQNIIFDPNVLTIGTGMAEHARYAVDFIEAVRWIKSELPSAKVSGGISNLSFAFRGRNDIRAAMHSAFLYHSIAAGLDMAIVNPALIQVYSEIDRELLQLVEDLIFARREDATDRLAAFSSHDHNDEASTTQSVDNPLPNVEKRIEENLLRGLTDGLDGLVEEAMAAYPSAMSVIEQVLMPAMEHIGRLFGEGKMFLPQVLKTARVLRHAIGLLEPHITQTQSATTKGSVVIATVKGDIHDIGKNIVSLVAGCNGFEVVDLGVMVDAVTIADAVEKNAPVAVLLSGLITPSLNEMVQTVRELERRGLSVPVIVGGATTTPLHTALKIAPEYSGPVIHAADAAVNSRHLAALVSDDRERFVAENSAVQQRLRDAYRASLRSERLLSMDNSRQTANQTGSLPEPTDALPPKLIIKDFDISDVEALIDWDSLLTAWDVRKHGSKAADNENYLSEARSVREDAQTMLEEIKATRSLRLQAVAQIFAANAVDEDIRLSVGTTEILLPMLRDQLVGGSGACAADFIARNNDRVCLFAVTAGVGLKKLVESYRSSGDNYRAVMAKLLADRLTEAFAQRLTEIISFRLQHPAVDRDEECCRIAFGYGSAPDHTLKHDVFQLLEIENDTDMRLTGNAMISPEESICGLILPRGRYFSIAKISEEQLADYACRRGKKVDEIRKYIPSRMFNADF